MAQASRPAPVAVAIPSAQQGTQQSVSSVAGEQFAALQQAADALAGFEAQTVLPSDSLTMEDEGAGLPAFVSDLSLIPL